MRITNKKSIQEGVQIVLLGKPDAIDAVYRDLGYHGDVTYYPAEDIHYTEYENVAHGIPNDKPFATQSYEFIVILANSTKEFQFVTCLALDGGRIAMRTLPRQRLLSNIHNFNFNPR